MRVLCPGLLALSLAACSRPPADVPPNPAFPSLEEPPPARAPIATHTALCMLELHPDGTVLLSDVRVKPIPFRGPVRQELAAPQDVAVTPGQPHATPEPVTQHTHATPTQVSWVMTVSHPQHAGVLLDVDLGAPGEGGGDVADRWANGSVLVRAPSWGAGTRFTLVKHGPQGDSEVARGEVAP